MENTHRPTAITEGVLWGVSTSAYQIEGAARDDGRGQSIWDEFCRRPGAILAGDTGDAACDHYHRLDHDLSLMAGLGIEAYRFSVSWSRIFPEGTGTLNPAGLGFYDRLIDGCLARGITPWLCAYHWDLPQALQATGGWASRDIASHFADYCTVLARRYGDRIRHIATMNEPSVFALFGHLFGNNAPGLRCKDTYLAAAHHINLAHGMATRAIRGERPGAAIGNIFTIQPVRPATTAAGDIDACRQLDAHWNHFYADPQYLGDYPALLREAVSPWLKHGDLKQIHQPLDWIGVNYYSPLYARGDTDAPLGFSLGDPPPETPVSDIGWAIAPDAFRDVLVEVSRRYGRPVYVMENGFGGIEPPDTQAPPDDTRRIAYLRDHLKALGDARTQGADIRGYFLWSLLDNFEWAFGYSHRFGIVHVDFTTQRRTPKASARWYRDWIQLQKRNRRSPNPSGLG